MEKKDPPTITIIKNKNHKFDGESLKDIPIFDMLLVNEKRTVEKLYSKLKKTKNMASRNRYYNYGKMARPGGFEPPTLGLENRCSIQLS